MSKGTSFNIKCSTDKLLCLSQGGLITGKSNCENLCFGGSSFTAARGPVTNYHDNTRMAGGSSSGSGVLVSDINFAFVSLKYCYFFNQRITITLAHLYTKLWCSTNLSNQDHCSNNGILKMGLNGIMT